MVACRAADGRCSGFLESSLRPFSGRLQVGTTHWFRMSVYVGRWTGVRAYIHIFSREGATFSTTTKTSERWRRDPDRVHATRPEQPHVRVALRLLSYCLNSGDA
jgi:hypothetical protein